MPTTQIKCMDCINYFVTWDSTKPRGCKVYGSKSMQFPSILVEKETGDKCLSFTPKKKKID